MKYRRRKICTLGYGSVAKPRYTVEDIMGIKGAAYYYNQGGGRSIDYKAIWLNGKELVSIFRYFVELEWEISIPMSPP